MTKQSPISNLINSSVKGLLTTTAITAVSMLSMTGAAKANDDWSDHTVVGGNGSISIDTSIVNQTNITQTGHRVRVEGDGDIKAGHTVNIAQDTSKSQYIFTDIESDATNILGNLNANGEVFIFDTNGVFMGEDAQIDVHRLVVSTGRLMSTDDELDAGMVEILNNETDGSIVNEGSITVAEGGLAGFVSPSVINSGIIQARMGTVALASGETATLDLYGDGLFEVAVDGELANSLIENSGSIEAQGGKVTLTAAAAKDVVDNIINMDGIIDVSSTTGDAGNISITGGNINLASTAALSADSATGAAGDVIVFADGSLEANGKLSAIGSQGTGFIETSGKDVSFGSDLSVLATNEWLIDPTDLTIDGTNEASIEGQLTVGNVTLTTASAGADAGNIDVNAVVDWATANTLTLNADNDVNINAGGGINATGAGNFVANAGNDINVKGGTGIVTNNGDITLNAGDEFHLVGGQVATFNGNILIDNAGSFEATPGSIKNFGSGTTELNQNKPSGSGDIANPTIQNAVDAVAASANSQTTINVGAGTWVESVNLDYNNLTLNGNNAGVHGTAARNPETVIASVSGPGFTSTNTDQIVIDGFTIDGGNQAGSVAVQGDNADNMFIDNNIIVNNEVGVDVANSHCPHTRNNLIDNNGTGVRYTNNTHAFVAVNTITNTAGNAVETNGVVENDIFQNTIDFTGGDAVHVVGGDDALISANLIGQNGPKDSIGGNGIHADGVDNLIIDANNIMNTAIDGIDLINLSQVNPDNQTFVTNNTITMAGEIGIDGENADNLFIDFNDISQTPIGIEVTDSHCPHVRNNTIDDVDVGVNYENNTHAFIAQNTITNVTGNAVQTVNVVENDIFNNVIDNVGGDAINIEGGADALVFNNQIGQNGDKNSIGGNGIHADAVDELIIDSNNIMNTAEDGIDLINLSQVNPDNKTFVTRNVISMAAVIGFDAENADNVYIDGNMISATPIGVEVTDSHCPFVTNNMIDDVEVGVNYENNTHAFISQNKFTNVSGNAIQTVNVFENDIFLNKIINPGGNAIDVNGGSDTLIFNNEIDFIDKTLPALDRDAIRVTGINNLEVNDNRISNVPNHGIHTDLITGQHDIHRNIITNTGNFAIFVENSSPESLQDNVITGELCLVEPPVTEPPVTEPPVTTDPPVVSPEQQEALNAFAIQQEDIFNTIAGIERELGGLNVTFLPGTGNLLGFSNAPASLNNLAPAGGEEVTTQNFNNIAPAAGDFASEPNFNDIAPASGEDSYSGVSGRELASNYVSYSKGSDYLAGDLLYVTDVDYVADSGYTAQVEPDYGYIAEADSAPELRNTITLVEDNASNEYASQNVASLNSIEAAAGQEEGTVVSQAPAEELNAIEAAAGSQETTCWDDAFESYNGRQNTTISFGGSAEDLIKSEESCVKSGGGFLTSLFN
jgi:hypothetical protein